jgi:hypothetical protein
MRLLLMVSILTVLFSCNSPEEKESRSIDEIAFDALHAMKAGDKEHFLQLFDETFLSQTPADQLDTAFEFYKTLLAPYDFPDYRTWKDQRFFLQVDTLHRVVAIGLPLEATTNIGVEYVFEIQFSEQNKIAGWACNRVPKAYELPESQFPLKEDSFNYTLDSVVLIRLYYLPGVNANVNLSREVVFTQEQFNDNLKNDFGSLLNTLDSSKIISAEKTISEQEESNELKAVIFQFRDCGKKRQLFLVGNNLAERPLDIHVFYQTNAAYAYHLSDANTIEIKAAIDRLFTKYLK